MNAEQQLTMVRQMKDILDSDRKVYATGHNTKLGRFDDLQVYRVGRVWIHCSRNRKVLPRDISDWRAG